MPISFDAKTAAGIAQVIVDVASRRPQTRVLDDIAAYSPEAATHLDSFVANGRSAAPALERAVAAALVKKPELASAVVSQLWHEELGSDALRAQVFALKDKNAQTRRWAAEDQVLMADDVYEPFIIALIDSLSDASADVRNAAFDSLMQSIHEFERPSLRPALIEAAQSAKEPVRAMVADLLGQSSGHSDFRAPLLALLADKKASVREHAARSLGSLRDNQTVPALVEAMRTEKNAVVRTAIVTSLGFSEQGAQHLRKQLTATSKPVRLAAAVSLASQGDEAALASLVALIDDPNQDISRQAMWRLCDLTSEQVATSMERLLTHSHDEIRAQAATKLGRLKNQRATAALLAASNDSSPQVRSAVATALGELNAIDAANRLGELIDDSADEVRSAAAHALGRIGSSATGSVAGQILEKLKKVIKSPNERTRINAARAIACLTIHEAVEPLLELLSSAEPDCQFAALEGLGRSRDPRAALPLAAFVSHTDAYRRTAAIKALSMINDPLVIEPLRTVLNSDPLDELRVCAAEALRRLGVRDAVRPFVDDLRSPKVFHRILAIRIVHAFRETAASDVLVEIMNADAEEGARRLATWALGFFADTRSYQPLTALVQDQSPNIRVKAITGLGQLGDKRAVPLIEQSLKDPDDDVKSTARHVLKQLSEAL